MKRKASVVWNGDLKAGQGTISTESGVLQDTAYSFSARFEHGTGTNPEELIAAAHAGCFSMAFASDLGDKGLKPESIETDATVQLEKVEGAWKIVRIHLETRPTVPLAEEADVRAAALAAKENCPVSKLLNTAITMEVSVQNADTERGQATSREQATDINPSS